MSSNEMHTSGYIYILIEMETERKFRMKWCYIAKGNKRSRRGIESKIGYVIITTEVIISDRSDHFVFII